jgi:hypothetical protein
MNQKALPRNEAMIRLACIVGACICFVIGLRFIYDDIAYHVNFEDALLFTAVPFLPIIFMAPRYKNGNIVYAFIGLAEVIIIVMNHFIVPR